MKTEKKAGFDLLLALTVIFIAANMRACYTGVGTIVGMIQADLGLNATVAGLISTIPILIFAVICPMSAPMSSKLGIGRMLFYGLVLNALGSGARAFGGAVGLFAGTAILALGIGMLNALMVGLIKLRFPNHTGLLTSLYTVTMALTSAMGISVNVPVATALGWRTTLGLYGVLCALAVLVWLPRAFKKEYNPPSSGGGLKLMAGLLRSRRAWILALFMGTQSMLFYCITAWMPSVLRWRGMSVEEAGAVATALQLLSLPATMLLPILMERFNWRKLLVIFDAVYILGMLIFGFTELGSPAMWVGIVLTANGLGSGFSACIYLFGKKTASPAETAAISGFSQCGGYILAAIGPVLMGRIYDVTGSWNGAMIFAFAVCIVMTVASIISAGRENVFEKN